MSLHDPRVLRLDHDAVLRVIAGTEEVGDGGDGGPAAEATFRELTAMVVAPDGTIYVSDGEANRVRRIDIDGTIQAFAGSSDKGSGGDGGPALEAPACSTPRGWISTPIATCSSLTASTSRVRRVDAATGTITTVAGNGSQGASGDGGPATAAQLAFPGGVAVDDAGGLYIADTFNHRVRYVDSSGVITTVAGTTKGYAGDGGPAVEGAAQGSVEPVARRWCPLHRRHAEQRDPRPAAALIRDRGRGGERLACTREPRDAAA